MRISDWSSDVCSSDLDMLVLSPIASTTTSAAVAAATAASIPPGSGSSTPEPSVTVSAPPLPITARMPVSRSTACLSSPRSEEHTSELQSLMRISYAVFCLKKKKQTYKHH